MDDNSHLPVWVERGLIAAVYILSAALTIFTYNEEKLRTRRRMMLTVLDVIASGCFLTSFVGLMLYLTGKLSIDAFGVLIIGTLPGLEGFRKIQSVLFILNKIRQKPALHNRLEKFMYMRHAKPPPGELRKQIGAMGQTMTYIRLPACAKAVPMKPDFHTWGGTVITCNEKVIELKGEGDMGNAVDWWKAANNAMDMVRYPSTVRLSTQEQVLRALELVAEIAMIGDTVLLYHRQSLENFVKHTLYMRRVSNDTFGTVYSTFLGGLGLLQEWGEMKEEKMERFRTTGFMYLERREEYGMLFFILLVESGLFSRARETFSYNRTAQDVIEAFRETREEVVRRRVTKCWLMQYCTPVCRLFSHDNVVQVQAVAPSG